MPTPRFAVRVESLIIHVSGSASPMVLKGNPMNSEQFVDVIRKVVSESTAEGVISVLNSPPGRRPRAELMAMSAFWHTASGEQKEMINQIVNLAVDNAVFGFLCVLDGVRAIEDSEDKGTLSLVWRKDDETVVLNQDENLHDYYNAV